MRCATESIRPSARARRSQKPTSCGCNPARTPPGTHDPESVPATPRTAHHAFDRRNQAVLADDAAAAGIRVQAAGRPLAGHGAQSDRLAQCHPSPTHKNAAWWLTWG